MRHQFCAFAVTAMLAGGAASAIPQTGSAAGAASDQLNLTQAQETTILLRLENEQAQAGSSPPEVGGRVPDGIALKRLPSDVGAQIPEAERFHYAKLEGGVVLADPGSKQVVKVIRSQPSAIGNGSLTAPGSVTSGSGASR